jgi:hypothetical protein
MKNRVPCTEEILPDRSPQPARRLAALLMICVVLLAGCSAAIDLTATRNVADRFMERLARGDLTGAYDMCDPNALTYDTLQQIANNPRFNEVFRNYQGLSHGEGGRRESRGEFTDVVLAPASVVGHEGWTVRFGLRRFDDGWKIMAFQIEAP